MIFSIIWSPVAETSNFCLFNVFCIVETQILLWSATYFSLTVSSELISKECEEAGALYKIWTGSQICMSFLHKGHVNLCIISTCVAKVSTANSFSIRTFYFAPSTKLGCTSSSFAECNSVQSKGTEVIRATTIPGPSKPSVWHTI